MSKKQLQQDRAAKHHHFPSAAKLYNRYEPMAREYALTLYNIEHTGLEREDIEQDLRMRIYSSILVYLAKWGEWQATGTGKPIPLVYYLKSALSNKIKDYIRAFSPVSRDEVRWATAETNKEKTYSDLKNSKANPNIDLIEKTSIDENFDIGADTSFSLILEREGWDGAKTDEAILNGVDLLKGLNGHHRKCFLLYITGISPSKLNKIYKSHGFDARYLINEQLSYLRTKKSELLDFSTERKILQIFES